MSAVLIAEILAGIFIVCAALISCFVASLLYLVWLHARLRPAGLAREAELLARLVEREEAERDEAARTDLAAR